MFDVPALKALLGDLRSRRVRLVPVDTEHASPFASSLLFNWVGQWMYEYDAPLAERRAAALSLDPDLLRELLGGDELRELIDPDVLVALELELQHLEPLDADWGSTGAHGTPTACTRSCWTSATSPATRPRPGAAPRARRSTTGWTPSCVNGR